MSLTPRIESCIVVGAGISGLLATIRLLHYGYRVIVLDKGGGVGGRMATRRIEEGVCDHGAQFFTARDPRFAHLVEFFLKADIVREWCRGFPGANGQANSDGHPRYRGVAGMTSLPKYLAQGLDIRTREKVIAVSPQGSGWSVQTESGARFEADALLMTPPVPQSLALLDAGAVALDPSDRSALEAISYDPCIATMAVMPGPTRIPAPGALQHPTELIDFLADNQQKGISPDACAVTIHASAKFSRTHWTTAESEVAALLLDSARAWLPDPPRTVQVHRWRYAKPAQMHPESILYASGVPPLAFAGDAFGAPRIEGAALSGWAASEALGAARNSASGGAEESG